MSQTFGSPMKDIQGYLPAPMIRHLLNYTKNDRDHLILRLLWATGCRISELVGDRVKGFNGIAVKDVLWDDATIIMDTLKRKQYPPPKRRVPVDDITLKMLKEYIELLKLKPDDKVFRITRQRVWQICRKLAKTAQIRKVGDKILHPHHFRHSHCVAWVRDNNTLEGLRQLQQRLNHADISTTAHYLQFATSETKEKVENTFGKW